MRYAEYQAAVAAFEAASACRDQNAMLAAHARYHAADRQFSSSIPDSLEEAANRVEEARRILLAGPLCRTRLPAQLRASAKALRAGGVEPLLASRLRRLAETLSNQPHAAHAECAAVLLQNVVRGVARPKEILPQ